MEVRGHNRGHIKGGIQNLIVHRKKGNQIKGVLQLSVSIKQFQYSLKCFCLQNNIDILFLQETHVSNLKKVNELNDYFDMYKCFWNFGTNFSRGTAIFINLLLI
jgi:exonuclease III